MKNLLLALAFVTVCLFTGNAIVVFAQDTSNITATLRTLSGSITETLRSMSGNVMGTDTKDIDTASGSVTVGAPDPAVPPEAKSIRISLRMQMAYLLEYGEVVKVYRISTGARETPTPPGNFMVWSKQLLRVSSQAVPYRMPNYMAITPSGSIGLHGLPWLGGSKESSAYWHEARSHIGIPVSHGCIRFLPEEAVEIYEWVDVGTPVFIRR